MNKNQLFKLIKKMTPGDVMRFVSQELKMNPAEFLTKNAGHIALKAVKSGWTKAGGIKDAVKNFSQKTSDDDTGIDWSNAEIEEASFRMKCMFDGDSGKKLQEFVKKLGDQMKKFASDEKTLNEENDSWNVELKNFAPAETITNALRKLNIRSKDFVSAINKSGTTQKQFDFILRKIAGAAVSSDDNITNIKRVEDIIKSDKSGMAMLAGEILKLGATDNKELANGLIAIPDVNLDNLDDEINGSLVKGLIDEFSDGASKTEIADTVKAMATDKIDSINSADDQGININGVINGNTAGVVDLLNGKGKVTHENFHNLIKSVGLKYDNDVSRIFARNAESAPSIRQGQEKVISALNKFLADYKKDSSAAVKTLMSDFDPKQKDALAELACKINPDAKDAFKQMGIDVNGKIDGLAKAVDTTVIDDAKTPKDAVTAAGQSKDAAQQMTNDEKMKQSVAKKTGIKTFTPLGWARIAAKTAGYVFNHGKDVIDALGAKKIAKNEDKNIIAEIRAQIENDVEAGKEYADSEYSVRFTIDDFKWHATCIDDRKMRVPEEILIEKILNTDTGKKFKSFCLKIWKNIFEPDQNGDYAMLPFILDNIDKFGIPDGDAAFFEKIKSVSDNMDKIEAQFN